MAEKSKEYLSQINDFRDLSGYYDIVFPNMRSLSVATYYKQLQELTDALREFIVNAAYDIILEHDDKTLDAKEILDLVDTEYSKVIDSKFYENGRFKSNLTNDQKKALSEAIDNYLKFTRNLRIDLNIKLGVKKLLPHQDTRPVRKVNKNLMRGDQEDNEQT